MKLHMIIDLTYHKLLCQLKIYNIDIVIESVTNDLV